MNSRSLPTELDPRWTSWITENLALGVSPEQIHDILSSNELGNTVTLAALRDLRDRPPYHAANADSMPSSKFERTLLSRYRLRRLRCAAGIKRVPRLDSNDFFDVFYCGNEPVIMTDLVRDWPLMSAWSPQYLRSRYGDREVEVQTGRSSDAGYELNLDRHRTRMSLRTYVGIVESAGSSNDNYMCANNRALDSALEELLDEIPTLDGYLDSRERSGRSFLWFGPGGTITPLHYDILNVLFVQVYGEKEFAFAPPEAIPYMYNSCGVFSDVDYSQPDDQRFPLFKNVNFLSATLSAGEALFIPVRWWHFVHTTEISISLSFTNFIWPNESEES